MELVSRREEVALVMEKHGLSERRACELLGVERSSYRYEARPERRADVEKELKAVAQEKPRFGYRRLAELLGRRGHKVNHKCVWRLYRKLGLRVRRKRRKRLARTAVPLAVLTGPNQEWSMDFVSDALASGQALRVLAAIDDHTRENLELLAATSIGSRRVTRALEKVGHERGYPSTIRVDNGPEFTSKHFVNWCKERKIEVKYIEPGKPVQNAYVESFNGRFREECLNANWFWNLADARQKIAVWREEYNHERPHSALDYRTPAEFAMQFGAPAEAASAVVVRSDDGNAASASAPNCMDLPVNINFVGSLTPGVL